MSSSISTWDIPNIIPPCPQVDGKRKAPRSVPVKVLLPHEVMHALAHSSEFAFNTLILGNTDSETRSAFWEHVSKQKPWSNQPCIHAAHASCTLDKLVGCSIHGDGTQMYREDEFFCWSWSSIFASMSGICKDVLLIKYPIAVIPERQMRSQEDSWLMLNKHLLFPHAVLTPCITQKICFVSLVTSLHTHIVSHIDAYSFPYRWVDRYI